MPRFRGQPVSVAGGTGGGIAASAGAQDHGSGGNPFSAVRPDRGDPAVLRLQGADRGVQPHLHAGFPQQGSQGAGHVAGLLRGRENPAPALHGYRTSRAFQQGHHILRGKEIQGGVKKAGIPGYLRQESVPVAVVGQIAAAFAGNVYLFPKLFILFQERDVRSAPGCKKRGGHSRCAASDYHNFRHGGSPPDRYGRIAGFPPAGGSAR